MNEEKYRDLSARHRLTQYLEEHKMRKTPERFAILDKIFSSSTHYDVIALYKHMNSDDYHVSKATIYNTLNVLVDAGLVRCVNLGDGVARYERITAANNHHHLICTRCGKVKEMKAIEPVLGMLSRKPRSFEPVYYTLYVYGLCARCAKQERSTKKTRKK